MKCMQKLTFLSSIVVISFLLLVFGLASPCFSGTKVVTLSFTEVGPPVGLKLQWDKWFCDEMEKRTNGRVKVKLYFAETLLKNRELLMGLKSGVADIGMMGAMWFPAQIPLQTAFSIPALGLSADFVENTPKVVKAIWEIWDTVPALKAELKKWNQTLLAISPWLPYGLYSKKSIDRLVDLKGLRVRELGAKGRVLYKPYGAIPVAISPTELYGALEKGVIDAISGNLEWGDRFGLKEVSKYLILTYFNCGSGIVTVNLDSVKKLSPSDQKVLFQLGRDYSFQYAQALYQSMNKKIEGYKKVGVIVKKFPKAERDKWRDNSETKIIEAWLKQVKKTGGNVSDAKEVIGKYLAAGGASFLMPK